MAIVTLPAVKGGTLRGFLRDCALSFVFCTSLAAVLTALFWGL